MAIGGSLVAALCMLGGLPFASALIYRWVRHCHTDRGPVSNSRERTAGCRAAEANQLTQIGDE